VIRREDARLPALSIESRFDLAYNASHALALAALRYHGYRSDNRYLVYQCTEVWRVLALCHDRRNRAEYEGYVDIDEQLVEDLMEATTQVLNRLEAAGAALPASGLE